MSTSVTSAASIVGVYIPPTVSSALTTAGAGIGFAMGGPSGAQWGAMIGGALGGMLQGAAELSGPRLSDLSVMHASDGVPIPVIFGTVRIAGNVLQSTEKRQRAKTSGGGGGGKGGGGGSPSVTTYTYDVDCAIGICAGPIVGVRRIWANGNLIYDFTPGATAAALLAGGKVAASVKIYTGTEDQMPDPTLEAMSGHGLTPAYRGTAYVVFTGLQLANFGNSIPNITFEVISSGTAAPFRRLSMATLPQQWRTGGVAGIGSPTVFSAGDVVRVGVAGAAGGSVYVYDLDGNFLGRETRRAEEEQWPPIRAGSYPDIYWGMGRLWNGDALCYRYYYGRTIGAGETLVTGGSDGIRKDASGGLPIGRVLFTACLSADGRYILSITAPAGATVGGGHGDRWHITEWDGDRARLVKEGDVAAPFAGYEFGPGNAAAGHFHAAMMESNLEYIWDSYGAGSGEVCVYRIGSDEVLRLEKVFSGGPVGEGIPTDSYPTVFADKGLCVTVIGDRMAVHTRIPAIASGSVSVSDVVSALCQRAGLSASYLDVSQLSDTLQGYAVSTQSSARACLEPLRHYSQFDVSEHAGRLTFVPRGGTVAAVIPWIDLGAHEGGNAVEPLVITMSDETEIASVVTVLYADAASDYQPAAQAARRNRVPVAGQVWPVAPATHEARVELPIVMSAARAARVADALLWGAWTSRRRAQLALPIKYASLKPADIVVVMGESASYRLRITKITDSGLVRQIEAEFEDAAIYTNAPPSAEPAGVPEQSIEPPGPTRLQLLDIPILRDTDDGPGFYAAAGRYLPGWQGATVYTSADAGQTWDEVQTFANSATLGSADDALPGWSGGNLFDESSRVTVRVSPGLQLASIAADAVLAGGNAALLGSEIVQFRNAELIGAGLYRLSGLLRGRRGTEGAMSTHAAGERFVLLSGVAGLARVVSTAADIGAPRLYKAVTSGESLDSTTAVEFSDTGVGLKPLAPVHINAGRDAAGNITLTWVRRSRIDAEWRDYADASLGESIERYEVDIYVGGASVATLASAQQSVTWPLPAQQAVAGAPVSAFTARVSQVSAVVGRGFEGVAVIDLPPSVIMLPDAPTVDPSLPAGYLRQSTVAHYTAAALAGSTPIAVVVDGTVPPQIRYLASADGGQTWSQIGTDSSTAPVVSPVQEWNTSLSSGAYVGVNLEDRNTPGAVPQIYRGTATTLPAYTGAGLLGGAWPKAIGSDGTNVYVITEAGRVWKSANEGTTFVDLGPLGGEFANLVGERVAAAIRLHKTAAGWLLESVSMYSDAYGGTGTQKAILRTTHADPVDGWVLSLDLRTGHASADYSGRLGRVGTRWITRTEGNVPAGRQSIFWVSDDSGVTWSSTIVPGQTLGGAYLSGLSGPYNLGGTPVYVEEGGIRYVEYTGSSWSPNTASGRPPFAAWRGVISLPSGGLIIPAWTNQGYAMYRSTNGLTWTVGTGINLD